MNLKRRHLLAASAASLSVPYIAKAASADPIVIGEVNSYSTFPTFTIPYRNAMNMAVEEINAKGGVGGRPLKLITKDDGANPQDAIRAATELVRSERVNMLAGGFLSNVGLALSSFAKHAKTLYVASEALSNALTWKDGNANTFRLTPSIYMLVAMMIDDAAKLPAKKWATVAPNYSYGTSAVDTFKRLLKAKRPDVTFVAEQWPTLDQIDAPATVAALAAAEPDGIFNATFASDLVAFVRQGNTTGLFKNRSVVSLITGEPEYLDSLGSDTPDGWIVTGYPGAAYTAPGNVAFVDMYKSHFKDDPDWGAVIGYTLIQSIAAGVKRSASLSLTDLEQGFAGASFPTPFGECLYRAIDHQSTLGAFVGKLAQENGKGKMVDFRYVDGASVLPPDAVVETLRPKS
ncbi:ABC transporter substrate-binding protein [Acidocella sp.]|uniref:ABC transporter substrate-binding protein n=1 Tax=Acidocella sp. TaxID=50710 RepID=UPI003D018F9C